jgi:DNA-3-methyladenine glycosylase I
MPDTKQPETATQPQSYCQFVKTLPEDDLHREYHDHHYGFPINDDEALFERLVWEINQAGLSWTTILKKTARVSSGIL